ncbi:MAG: methyltransferase domain-containing protein [Thermoanaerobaculales bacterium]|nr:methyltransferase domain-containing protein [Thermoanaerobaculales bacterium]
MASHRTDPAAGWAPLGAALLAYHRGELDAEVTVSSDIWEDETTPAAAYYRPDDDPLPELEQSALAHCRGRVLDLGAGAGRHALELQRGGHSVVAVDLLPEAVEIMRDRGVGDVRRGGLEAVEGEVFDTVLMLMHGLGVAGTLRGLGELLEALPSVLAAGGRLVCDSADLAAVMADESPDILDELAAADHYLGEVRFSLSFGTLVGQPYPWLFVDPNGLSIIGAAAGFEVTIAERGGRGSFLAVLVHPQTNDLQDLEQQS